MRSDIFIITPPFTQLNTPYPASAYIKGFLNTKGISSYQADLGIEVIMKLFSRDGLTAMFKKAETVSITDANIRRIISLKEEYLKTIDTVISFLQGKNPTLSMQISIGDYLPEASRFSQLDELDWAFGTMGVQDKAKHLATLYLEDLSDFIVACIDENFGFSRYAERLGRSANSFDELYAALRGQPTYTDVILLNLLKEKLEIIQSKLLLVSVPFPGNLYSAFRIAKYVKQSFPEIEISMGGGFANTELRSLSDKRVFEFFDYITLDDGELPIELLYKNICESGTQHFKFYKRTFLLENDEVIYKNDALQNDYKQANVGTPDYTDLYLDAYISVIEMINPMHRMWSDGRWNKLTMAHGCYWGKCTFCDISLDYIKNYQPVAAALIVDRMVELSENTGQNGFHFVDEAAPPALMRDVALEILRRKIAVTWWANIRFEKSFTGDLCILLKASGCIAVSGGLEVASDRLLKLIDKGVTVTQVAQVTRNFTESGIMVHAYLMYGYPTQTIQETVDSLEMVRQMFEQGVLQSGFWHQFAMTAHSPVGMYPEKFGVIKDTEVIGTFANNDIDFKDKSGIDHNIFSFGLKKSLFNFMHGLCFDFDLQEWFDFRIPKTKIPANFIVDALNSENRFDVKPSAKVVWISAKPTISFFEKKKKGRSWEMATINVHTKKEEISIHLNKAEGAWLFETLNDLSLDASGSLTFNILKNSFEKSFENFELFWFSKPMELLKSNGLLVL